MLRIVNGHLVQVPDDETITPELQALSIAMDAMLQQIVAFHHSPRGQELYRWYRSSACDIKTTDGFEWYLDSDHSS